MTAAAALALLALALLAALALLLFALEAITAQATAEAERLRAELAAVRAELEDTRITPKRRPLAGLLEHKPAQPSPN